MQGNVGAFHNRSGSHGELVAAIVAEEHARLCFALHAVNAERATMRAGRFAVPARSFDMLAGCVLVVKDFVGDIHGFAPCRMPEYAC